MFNFPCRTAADTDRISNLQLENEAFGCANQDRKCEDTSFLLEYQDTHIVAHCGHHKPCRLMWKDDIYNFYLFF